MNVSELAWVCGLSRPTVYKVYEDDGITEGPCAVWRRGVAK